MLPPLKSVGFLAHLVKDRFKNAGQMGPFQVESFTENRYKRSIVAEQMNQFLSSINLSSVEVSE
jgi:hypothetical protein